MKFALDWYIEKKLGTGGQITVKDLIALQNDARKDGLMTAQGIASDVIRREAPKYAVRAESMSEPPSEMALSGLAYFVTSAITTEADNLDYLPPTP
jgi:hypothetical protein